MGTLSAVRERGETPVIVRSLTRVNRGDYPSPIGIKRASFAEMVSEASSRYQRRGVAQVFHVWGGLALMVLVER